MPGTSSNDIDCPEITTAALTHGSRDYKLKIPACTINAGEHHLRNCLVSGLHASSPAGSSASVLVRDPTAYLRQRDRAGAQLRAEKTKTPIPSEFTLRACLLCFMADALRAMKSISGIANTTL